MSKLEALADRLDAMCKEADAITKEFKALRYSLDCRAWFKEHEKLCKTIVSQIQEVFDKYYVHRLEKNNVIDTLIISLKNDVLALLEGSALDSEKVAKE